MTAGGAAAGLRARLAAAGESLGRVAGTARLEVKLNLTGPGPWVVGGVLGVLGYLAVRTAPDASSFPLGWLLSTEIGPFSAVLLLFLAASLAHRPQRYEVSELQDSKLAASEEVILGRWLGMVAALLAALLVGYGATAAGQAVHSRSPVEPLAYLFSLGRVFPSALFLATLAFCLVTVTRVLVLGAGLAGLLWFALTFAPEFFPTVLWIGRSQNAGVYLGLTAGVLLLMLLLYRGRRRAKRSPATRLLAGAAAAALAATLLHAGWAHLALPGSRTAAAAWRRLNAAQRRQGDPLPNFAWVDLQGRRRSLASLRGRPALLIFFQPGDGGLVPLLRRAGALREELGGEVELLGICLSEDLHAAGDAARLAGTTLPLVTDWGRPAEEFDARRPPSAASLALKIARTPAALLVDAAGREQQRNLALDEENWEALRRRLRAAAAGEPAPPAEPPGDEAEPGGGGVDPRGAAGAGPAGPPEPGAAAPEEGEGP